MNPAKIFQNSWNLMLHYRALWIFGVVLALTTISFGSALWMREEEALPDQTLVDWELSPKDRAWIQESFGFDLPLRYVLRVEDLGVKLDEHALSTQEKTLLVATIGIVTAVLLSLLILILGLRYTAEGTLIFMVNERQHNERAYRARQGWALGFPRAAIRLFLIDLVVFSLLFILTPLLFLPAMLPVFIAITGTPAGITIGVLLMTSLSLVSLAALIMMWLGGALAARLAHRACCLEGLGVFAAIWRGYRLMRRQLFGVGLTWLVIAGLELVYPLLAAPVGILLAAAGVAVGGLFTLVLGALLALFLAKSTAWTIALIMGLVLLALIALVPLVLLGGLREVFKSSAWTLTYTEAAGQPAEVPAPKPVLPLTPRQEPA